MILLGRKISIEELQLYESLVTHWDVEYKQGFSMDIMMPTKVKPGKIPVVVYIHGGGWKKPGTFVVITGRRKEVVLRLLEEGYAVISVEYHMVNGKNVFPENILDVKDAIRWIRKYADTYGFDVDKIGVWGSSAGGHLALMAAYTKDEDFLGIKELQPYSSKVRYVINWFAPVDILALWEMKEPEVGCEKIKQYFGSEYDYNCITKEQREIIDKCFPINYVSKDSIPTLIVHGTADVLVPIEQARMLYEKLLEFKCDVRYVEIDGGNHGLSQITEEDAEVMWKECFDFMEIYAK